MSRLLSDSILQDRLDSLIEDCRMFYENQLPTTLTQVRQDMKYIKVVCSMNDLDPRPALQYYKRGLREITADKRDA